ALVPDLTVEQPAAPVEGTVAPPGAERTRLDTPSGEDVAEPAPDALPVGSRLGPFRLLGVLGQGGMGTVYRAEGVADGTLVAVRVLRADLARRADSRKRFQKEVRLLREVNNPYVTNLVDANEDRGIHYLALEYVAGQDLAEWLDRHGRLEEAQA